MTEFIDLQTAIGRRIGALRNAAGMKQEDLAFELDVSVKHCSECERGVAMYSLERLLDICDIFDVSLDFLVRGVPLDSGLNFPNSMKEIFESNDKEEIALLKDYLNMYGRLRRTKETGR